MPDKIESEQIVPAGQPWSAVVRKGQRLRIVDIEGDQGVDFLCYAAVDPAERYHAANTLKKSTTLRLTKGHTLYSDVARPMMTIVGDTCGMHDTIAGCCSAP
ncbi:MAG TPA: urea carboxylase-associated family protein, partial [Dongiaceae bacterium]|nr:urea carboxylase-associated family protein [Dongiaceae bacterium]